MYEYKCKLDRVVDGDTIDAWIDLGFNIRMHKRIRLYGIDTPELRTRDLIEKEAGIASTEFVKRSLYEVDNKFTLHTLKDNSGKYGRLLGIIMIDDTNLNKVLIDRGLAVEYMK